MSTIEVLGKSYAFNRTRTLSLLDDIEKMPDTQAVLAWRPAPGRAHIGWQLMHIGITEEIFATQRLVSDKRGKWAELWPRFRGGSTPDDDVPSATSIREVLKWARGELRETLAGLSDADLELIPPGLAERQWTLQTALYIIAWHEAHHQGQAHATFNAYKSCHA